MGDVTCRISCYNEGLYKGYMKFIRIWTPDTASAVIIKVDGKQYKVDFKDLQAAVLSCGAVPFRKEKA